MSSKDEANDSQILKKKQTVTTQQVIKEISYSKES
jgi:hypothetical protein